MKDMSSKIILDYMHQVEELQVENCLLKGKLEHDEKLLKKARIKISEKENKIYKAIEYIDKHSEMTDLNIYGINEFLSFRGNVETLLNILKGSDKE